MRKYTLFMLSVIFLVLVTLSASFSAEIIWEDLSRGNSTVSTVLVDPGNPRIIYIGSKSAVLKSQDQGQSWKNILSVAGQSKKINYLAFDERNQDALYAATGKGLFYSPNQGKSWSIIFKGKNYLEDECTTLVVLTSGIHLGTKAGLFFSKDQGRSWQRYTGKLGNSHILAIACNSQEANSIYVASTDGVFVISESGQSWERLFIPQLQEDNRAAREESQDDGQDQDEEENFSHLRHISIDPRHPEQLYLATSKGVYRSYNQGKQWAFFNHYGLLSQDIKFILVSGDSRLYAATKTGVFEYKTERWEELSLRLVAQEIRFLTLDSENNLYAACDEGLFKARLNNNMADYGENAIALDYQGEPAIGKVHQAAIKYAEVSPEKIISWRKQAAKRAWLPKLGMKVGRNITDLWHWEGGSTVKAGDDILRKGRDAIEWDVSLGWDLGELIFADAQTSIDVRSRLMVQLRDDVLDEVNKLYFERLRVKMELDNLSLEERKKRLEKQLRLAELTASLDALTGGYFSQYSKK